VSTTEPQEPFLSGATPAANGRAASADAREDGPPPLAGPVESILRAPILTFAPAVLLVFVAIVVAGLRTPVYTASASINVGRVDVPAFTLQGVTIGNATLALGYSRFVAAQPVIHAAAAAARIPDAEAESHLTASPVPNSTLIVVEAKGHSSRGAQQLANGAAQGLIAYVRALTSRQQQTGVLNSYRDALAVTNRRQKILESLMRTHSAGSAVVEQAQLDYQTAKLRSTSLGNRYLSQEVSPAPQNLLQLAVPATDASSDLISMLERMILVAIAAGLVAGVALALWSANRPLLVLLRTWA
jgi:capsular polysaccharide biosynthesis protein